MESALYLGSVRHRRFAPRAHAFSYRLFMAFLDIDRLPELLQVSPFSSYNAWNWASFYEADHFGDARQPLRRRLAEDAARHGLTLPKGQIFLLTHLRYLGYTFNPVSFFYCYDEQEQLALILAEVNNTFGEMQNYWLSPAQQTGAIAGSRRARRFDFPKSFHVSPFLPNDCRYEWSFTEPREDLIVQTNCLQAGTRLFDATLALERLPWNSTCLHSVLIRHPWVTLKVIAAIHWQAVRLFLKRTLVTRHPGPGRFTPAATTHRGARWSNRP